VIATLLVPLLLAAAPAAPQVPLSAMPGHAGNTPCAQCHTPDSWKTVSFDHDRTGFRLTGAHRGAACQGCHAGAFESPVPMTCGGCHRDPHRGELGQRCEGCHETTTWASTFSADAHRRTSFPLNGRHAFIPCNECHPDARDRGFSGNAVTCERCHLKDYQGTAGTSVDHAANHFPLTCLTCHDAWSFRRATWPQHDRCFLITGGPHAGVTCLGCHTSLRGATASGTCSTNTASCTRSGCHGRSTDAQHPVRDVPGYQYKDRKCWECHRFSSASLNGLLRGLR
jgi:hypothetical protein